MQFCPQCLLGVAIVARVVKLLSGTRPKVSISSAIGSSAENELRVAMSSAIDGRKGDDEGELCATCESSTSDWFDGGRGDSGGLQGSADVE